MNALSKLTLAGKGGVGKTTLTALVGRRLAATGVRVLVVDCDPNPTLAEELGRDSSSLPRFSHAAGLARAGETLRLREEPELVEVEPNLSLLGGPPSAHALADAIARGIAGVLLGARFDLVITDLGAGPELAEAAVGGVLNPAELCVVVSDGQPSSERTARRIEAACARRDVRAAPVLNPRGSPERGASRIVTLVGGG